MGLRRRHRTRDADHGHSPGQEHDHGHDHDEPPLPPHLADVSIRPGRDYVYEREVLLVPAMNANRLAQLLRDLDDVVPADPVPVGDLGVVRVPFHSRRLDVPGVLDEVDALGGRDLRAGPNHVLGRASHPSLLSVTPPRPAGERPNLYEEPGLPGEGVAVGVLDTGAWDHPYFAGRCDFRPAADLDQADADGDEILDYASGHGTFIAGVIFQHAPRATVVARRLPSDATDPTPHQDYITDTELALALAGLPELREVNVLNLSLGGYTHDGVGLMATEAVLTDYLADNPNLVIVAGAGNEASSEPFFPAALKQVIAVAALDSAGQERACFSNYGWWVDACAPGVDVHSTFLEWHGDIAPYPHPVPHGCEGLIDLSPENATDGFHGWARWDGTSFAAPRVAAAIVARISDGRSPSEAVFDVIRAAPGARRLPLLGTVVNPQSYP